MTTIIVTLHGDDPSRRRLVVATLVQTLRDLGVRADVEVRQDDDLGEEPR